jgi:uncharacterized membrane protein YbhN (UPF0104 family)
VSLIRASGASAAAAPWIKIPGMAAPELPLQHRRRALWVALGGIVLAVGVGVAIGKAADYTRLLHEMRNADTRWLPLCVAGEILAYVGYVMAYRATARVAGGPMLGVFDALRIVAASFGALVVATGAGALAFSYWALRRAGADRNEAFARVLALNTLEWGVLGTAAAAAAAAMLVGVPPRAPVELELVWLALVPACVAAAMWVSSPRRRERLAAATGGRVRRLFADAVRGVVLVPTGSATCSASGRDFAPSALTCQSPVSCSPTRPATSRPRCRSPPAVRAGSTPR